MAFDDNVVPLVSPDDDGSASPYKKMLMRVGAPADPSTVPGVSAQPAMTAQPVAQPVSPVQAAQPAQPQAPTPPPFPQDKYTDVQNRIVQNSTPTDRNAIDPKTGKPMYKMGIGGRILGTLANFGAGMAGKGPVEYVGPGALNSKYYNAEGARATNLGAAENEEKDLSSIYGEQIKGFNAADTGYKNQSLVQEREAKASKYENAIDPNSIEQGEDGKWYGSTYGGDKKEIGEPKWSQQIKAKQNLQDTKPGLAETVQTRRAEGTKAGLKGDKLEQYALTGKIPEGMTEYQKAELNIRNRELDERIKKDGEKVSAPAHAKDRQSFEEHWGNRFQKEVEKPFNAQRQAILKTYGADKDPKAYAANKDEIDPKIAALEADRESTKAKLQSEKDSEAEQYGVYNSRFAGRQPAAAPAQSAPAAPQTAKPATEERVPVRDKTSGKTGSLPKSQLKAALATGKYEQL